MAILDNSGGIVTDYGIRTEYVWDMGLIGLPVGGPVGTPQDIAQLYPPVCYKVVTWTASRIGAKPKLPSPDTGNPNEVLANKSVSPAMPGNTPDTSDHWTVSGTYTYILKIPPSDGDPIPCGAYPYGPDIQTDNQVVYSDFSKGIIESPGVSATLSVFPFNSGEFLGTLTTDGNRKPGT